MSSGNYAGGPPGWEGGGNHSTPDNDNYVDVGEIFLLAVMVLGAIVGGIIYLIC